MAMAANRTVLRTECSHYLSRETVEEYQKHITEIPLELPENQKLFWCGKKEKWMFQCGSCTEYDIPKDHENGQPHGT